MKKLFIFSAVIAASLIATTGYSQVYVNAHVGLRLPGVRVYATTAPAPVVYQTAPAPVVYQTAPVDQDPGYQDGYAPAPAYQEGYDPATVVYENEFPGYAYYNYPVWNGHFRDRIYYEHYRPYFERENVGYFNRGRFDRGRFEQERVNRGYSGRGYSNRGFAERGSVNRGYGERGSANRGYSDRGNSGHNDRGGWDHRGHR
jgi:hypothetical protein